MGVDQPWARTPNVDDTCATWHGTRTMSMVTVTFEWSDEMGECSDCGNPAAYENRSLSSRSPGWASGPVAPEALRCSVCAAMDASRGDTIVWLFEEDA